MPKINDECQNHDRKRRVGKSTLIKLFQYHGVDIPSGMSILHLCDNPSCSNWNHLMLGSQSENIKQAYERNRLTTSFRPGEKHINAKLINDDISQIISLHREGWTQVDLVKEFNINQCEINRILWGKRRQSVTGVI